MGFSVNRSDWIVYLCLASLLLLFAGDVHSTLLASSKAAEVNRFILFLSHWVGFTGAVLVAKSVGVLAAGCLYLAWRTGDAEIRRLVPLVLVLAVAAYSVVVFNNYRLAGGFMGA